MALSKSKTFERYLADEKFRGRVDHLFSKVEPMIATPTGALRNPGDSVAVCVNVYKHHGLAIAGH